MGKPKRKPAKSRVKTVVKKAVEPTQTAQEPIELTLVADERQYPEDPQWAASVPPAPIVTHLGVEGEPGERVWEPVRSIQQDLAEAGPLIPHGQHYAIPNALHRRIVWDLAAAKCSQREIATVMNCGLATLQRNFAVELDAAHSVTHGTMIRALAREGQGGNVRAMENYIRLNKDFQPLQRVGGVNGNAIEVDVNASAEEKQRAAEWQVAILAALEKKPAKLAAPKTGAKK